MYVGCVVTVCECVYIYVWAPIHKCANANLSFTTTNQLIEFSRLAAIHAVDTAAVCRVRVQFKMLTPFRFQVNRKKAGRAEKSR